MTIVAAGPGHADHLAERALGVVEVVEGADAQDGVELAVVERQVLGLAQDQADRTLPPARVRQASSCDHETSTPTTYQSSGSQGR